MGVGLQGRHVGHHHHAPIGGRLGKHRQGQTAALPRAVVNDEIVTGETAQFLSHDPRDQIGGLTGWKPHHEFHDFSTGGSQGLGPQACRVTRQKRPRPCHPTRQFFESHALMCDCHFGIFFH